jgi:hypothetical protein
LKLNKRVLTGKGGRNMGKEYYEKMDAELRTHINPVGIEWNEHNMVKKNRLSKYRRRDDARLRRAARSAFRHEFRIARGIRILAPRHNHRTARRHKG